MKSVNAVNSTTTACSICLSASAAEIGVIKSPYTGDNYSLYQCEQCKSRSFDMNQYPIDLGSFYDNHSSLEQYVNHQFTVSKYWQHELLMATRALGRMPASVLDVGCRTGDYLMHYPEQVLRVGIELSAPAAAVASERGITVLQQPLEDVEFDRKFDVVTCYAVMEHLQEPIKCLEKLAALVNEGGVIVVLVPSFQTLKPKLLELLRVRWHMYSPPEHLNMYSREFLDSTLKAMGYELLDRRYTSGGIFNPFSRIPVLRGLWRRLMWYIDTYTPLNRMPVFDHMYSYYQRRM